MSLTATFTLVALLFFRAPTAGWILVATECLLGMVLLLILAGLTLRRFGEASYRWFAGGDAHILECEFNRVHRLLHFDPQTGAFAHDAKNPLPCDLLVIDEMSMLDIVIAHHLFKAIGAGTRVVLVGDPDQLPSVATYGTPAVYR